ncbi:MAG: oligosaccharide flippase family protein, partial [Gemmatimonadales bacterium]
MLVNGLVQLGVLAFLARRLTPADYGLMGLAGVFSTLGGFLGQFGIGVALVQRPELSERDVRAGFTLAMGLALALALLTVAAAPLIAVLFRSPDLVPVLRVLSLTFPFTNLGYVAESLLDRALAWRRNMWVNLISTVVGNAAVACVLAVLGFGVWSLVVQTVLAPTVGLVFIIPRSGYRPGRSVSRERFRELFTSSRHFLGSTLMSFLNGRADDFLIGATLGSVLLGVYAVAYRVLTVMIDVLSTTSRSVAFPVFSRVQRDRERLGRAYTSVTRMCAVIAMPGYLLAFAAAPEIVDVVFGQKWHA